MYYLLTMTMLLECDGIGIFFIIVIRTIVSPMAFMNLPEGVFTRFEDLLVIS